MDNIDYFPKSIKKAVRYIKQEATKEQLEQIKMLVEMPSRFDIKE